ncbi:unnamed protein product [Sphagnum jensenii]
MKTVHTFVRKVSLPLSRGPVRDPTKVPLSCSPPKFPQTSTVPNPEAALREEGDRPRARKSGGATRVADSTDWIASSLTRRFGLGAGLAWVGVLAFGVVSEQIKTRTEVFLEEQGTRDVENAKEVVFPNNIRYVELRAGGGASPQRGDLVVVDLIGKIESTGEVFVDTSAAGNKRSLAFVFGARPYAGGMCDGLEFVLRSMKVGGKRRVIVPPELGFGETGADLSSGARIPSQSTLEYIVQLQRVSIAPS